MKLNIYISKMVGKMAITTIALILLSWIQVLPPAFSQNVIAPGTTFKVASGTTVMSAENLVVKDGSLLSNAGSLVLKKGLTNEYTVPYAIGTGTAEFSGVANQSVLGQNIIQNLTVNNSTGVTLGGNTNVTGIMTLTTGPVSLGSNNLLLGPSATVAGTPSATAMVVATGTGELRKEFASGFTGSFTWPVGDATVTAEYSPVTLTFSAGTFGTGNYTGVKLVNSAYTGMVGSYLNRYWMISQNAVTSPLFNAMFQYLPADVVGTESQIICLKVNPTPVIPYGAANTTLHQLTATGVTSAGTFTGGLSCTLAVTPSNQNVLAAAGSTSFSVTSSCAWTAVSNQTWCTVTSSGTGTGTITANYTANTTTSVRTANVTVTVAGLAPIVVTVTQSPPCTLSVTPSNQNVLAAAGSTSFSVTSSCAWTAVSNQTWCTVTTSGTGTGTLTANYSVNTTTSVRTANVTVTVSGVTPIVVTVTQDPPPTCTLTVTPANQNVPATPAGSTTFSVTSACAWTAVSNQTWCTVTTSGTGTGTLTANYTVNTGTTRTANITVSVSGITPVVVTVTQTGSCTLPWQPIQNQQFNMNVIAKLYLSNVLTTNPADAIGAFVGTECRGIAYPDPALNGIIFLTITSDVQTGETVTFKAWKSATCEECPVAETMSFVNQSEIGTVNNPYEFHCGMVQLCVNFGAGYTWFSVNVNPGSMALNSLFSNLTPCENDRIIGQQSFATYYGTQWVGSLSTLDAKAMYKMKLCSQQTWCKQGLPVSIGPITIASGYPWIGYLPQSDLPINTALAGLVPAAVSNDRFNGQSSFATSTGTQWVGTLSTLQKGKGYIIHLANSSVLTYPTGMDYPEVKTEDPPAVLPTPAGDIPVGSLRYNMQLISRIILPDGSPSVNSGDVVYAYVGNECRGMSNPVAELNGRLFLSVGSNVESGEEVTFKVYVSGENRLYEAKNKLIFNSELETGEMGNPYLFNLAGLNGVPLTTNASGIWVGEVYPNPFDETASLEFKIDNHSKVEGKIINGYGQVIVVVINKELETGSYVLKLNGEALPSGLYSLLLTCTNNHNRSVVLKKMIVR